MCYSLTVHHTHLTHYTMLYYTTTGACTCQADRTNPTSTRARKASRTIGYRPVPLTQDRRGRGGGGGGGTKCGGGYGRDGDGRQSR